MNRLWFVPLGMFLIAGVLALVTSGAIGDTATGAFIGYGIGTILILRRTRRI